MAQGVLSLPRRRPSALARLLPSARTLLIVFALMAIAGGFYGLARETSMFAIRSVDVTGAPPGLVATVRAQLAPFEGAKLTTLDGAAVVQRVEDLPQVVSATYDRDFPHTLRVRVVPEKPVAVLRSGTASWLISARGRVIAAVPVGRYRPLPRIWVPRGLSVELGSFLEDESGVAARALRDFVAAGFARGALWARLRDDQLSLGPRSGLELRFGPPTDLALKIAVVRGVLPTMPLPANGGPTYLDVSVPERPVAGANPQVGG